jgi:hypothetical protein
MRRNDGSRGSGPGALAAIACIALTAAGYLAYLAIDFVRSGCDCGGGSVGTAAGIIRAAVLIFGAAALCAIAAVAAVRGWRARPR